MSACLLLEQIIQRAGYETAAATNGQEAVSRIRSFQPDLVISDMMMPGVSKTESSEQGGLELLRHVRSRNPNIKFLMVTAIGSVETAVESIKLGASDYVQKPVDIEQLLRKVRTCLEHDRPLRVFLCHSSSDKAVVRKLFTRLRRDRFDPWLDEKKLLPGQNWQLEIEKAVRECDCVVVCLSDHSITKEGFVQKEIRVALDLAEEKPEGTIFIIPVRLEPCAVPERLRLWQWVDLFENHGYAGLLGSLRLRSKGIAPHPKVHKQAS
jgi:DNA-binding response OmpR family regulator